MNGEKDLDPVTGNFPIPLLFSTPESAGTGYRHRVGGGGSLGASNERQWQVVRQGSVGRCNVFYRSNQKAESFHQGVWLLGEDEESGRCEGQVMLEFTH